MLRCLIFPVKECFLYLKIFSDPETQLILWIYSLLTIGSSRFFLSTKTKFSSRFLSVFFCLLRHTHTHSLTPVCTHNCVCMLMCVRLCIKIKCSYKIKLNMRHNEMLATMLGLIRVKFQKDHGYATYKQIKRVAENKSVCY